MVACHGGAAPALHSVRPVNGVWPASPGVIDPRGPGRHRGALERREEDIET